MIRALGLRRGVRGARALHLALYRGESDEAVRLQLSHPDLEGKTREELEAVYAGRDGVLLMEAGRGAQVATRLGAKVSADEVGESFRAVWPDAASRVTFVRGTPPESAAPVSIEGLDLAEAASESDFFAKYDADGGDPVFVPVHAPVAPRPQKLPPVEAVLSAAAAVAVGGYLYS